MNGLSCLEGVETKACPHARDIGRGDAMEPCRVPGDQVIVDGTTDRLTDNH